jgi:hypothetical protein
VQLVDDNAIARGMIRVSPGEDLIAALEALALAAGWTDGFVTGAGTLEIVELARGVETMTFDNAQLVQLSGRVTKRGDGCEATLTAGVLANGALQSGRIAAAVTGDLLLVIDAVLGTSMGRRTAEGLEPRQRMMAPTARETGASTGITPPGPAVVADDGDERSATKPLSQTFTAKPVIVPRGREAQADEADDDHWMDVVAGDFLEHPQLGFCEVVGDDESGGMRVRIPSGRVCVLRLDALQIMAPADNDQGQRVFKVAGPKKRR